MTYEEKVQYWSEYCKQKELVAVEDRNYINAEIWSTIPDYLTWRDPMRRIFTESSNEELKEIVSDLFSYACDLVSFHQEWDQMFLDSAFDWCDE